MHLTDNFILQTNIYYNLKTSEKSVRLILLYNIM